MAVQIIVPRLGWTMEEGTFNAWLKKDGDRVEEGDLLFVLESDKTTQEIESLDSGILRIAPDSPRPGDTVAVGALLGYLVAPGEAAPFELPAGTPSSGPSPQKSLPESAAPAARVPTAAHAVQTAPRQTTPAISPRAARVAGELGVDWLYLVGSGRTGRIVERDVRAAAARKGRVSPSLAGRTLPTGPVRRLIAERMTAGVHSAAPCTLTTRADATNLVTLREQLRSASGPGGSRLPGCTDLLVKIAGRALEEHPLLNSFWTETGTFLPEAIHIGIAVDTEAGVVVPVVRDVASKSLFQVAEEAFALAEKARSRRLRPDDVHGGTFTVTNLGMYGIDAFTPILNLPQCAVLGIGRIVAEPAFFQGQVVRRDLLTLSLTFDHRVVDGAPAARFLARIRELIEQPDPTLVEGAAGLHPAR